MWRFWGPQSLHWGDLVWFWTLWTLLTPSDWHLHNPCPSYLLVLVTTWCEQLLIKEKYKKTKEWVDTFDGVSHWMHQQKALSVVLFNFCLNFQLKFTLLAVVMIVGWMKWNEKRTNEREKREKKEKKEKTKRNNVSKWSIWNKTMFVFVCFGLLSFYFCLVVDASNNTPCENYFGDVRQTWKEPIDKSVRSLLSFRSCTPSTTMQTIIGGDQNRQKSVIAVHTFFSSLDDLRFVQPIAMSWLDLGSFSAIKEHCTLLPDANQYRA